MMKRLLSLLAIITIILSIQLFQPVPSRTFTTDQKVAVADKPVINRVDPPNWWIGHSVNPVQLIMRGHALNNSTITINSPGIKVLRSNATANGDFLTVYLVIDAAIATPGEVKIAIENAQGGTEVSYPLLALPETTGRNQGFNPDDVIYLIMVDRFADGDATNNDPARSAGFYDRRKPRAYHGGDLQGIIDHLSYLKDLGITTLWLTPIYDNSDKAGDYHGYGAVDFYSVDEHFGDLTKFKELVARAHALGIKIVQDQVMNHTGPDHPWVDNRPTPDFFNGTSRQHLNCAFDIPAITQPNGDAARVDSTVHGWFANILPDLNLEDTETSQYFIQNSLWWLAQTGLDGVRLDTFPYVARSFWSQWNLAIKKQYPQLTVVGEVLHGDPKIVSFFQGGVIRFDGIDSNLDTTFDYPSCYVIREYFANNKRKVSEIIKADSLYPRAGVLLPFFGNHDIKRFASMPGVTPQKQVLAYTYLLTMRGTPQVYYGDEIGMEGIDDDPDNRRDFPGGFPGDPRSAFSNDGRTRNENFIFQNVRKLLQLRQSQRALRGGEMSFLRDSGGLLTYLRARDNEHVIVAINNKETDAKWNVDLSLFAEGTSFIDLLNNGTAKLKDGKLIINLKARSAAIFKAGN